MVHATLFSITKIIHISKPKYYNSHGWKTPILKLLPYFSFFVLVVHPIWDVKATEHLGTKREYLYEITTQYGCEELLGCGRS